MTQLDAGRSFLLALALVCPIAAAQEAPTDAPKPRPEVPEKPKVRLPEGVVARVDGRDITRTQYFEFLGRTAFKQKDGDQTVSQLIDETIVRSEAQRRDVEVTDEAIAQRIETFRQRVQERSLGKKDFDQYLAAQGISLEDLASLLQLVIAQEQMVRIDAHIPPGNEIPTRDMNLWLTEMRKKNAPELLGAPEGNVVARVAGQDITFEVIGAKLYQVLPESEKIGRLRELANLTLLFAIGVEMEVEVTDEDLDAEMARRRALLAENEQLQGISYEEFLKAQGLTLADVRRSRKVRAGILLDRIIDRLYPREQLEAAYAERKEEFDSLYGRKRRASLILLRSGAYPNALRQRSLDEARLELEEMRERIRKGTGFDYLARTYSEHGSKERGGDLGNFTAEDPNIPKEIRQIAFTLEKDQVSSPVRVSQGYALVMVTDIEDNPGLDAMREAIRNHLKREWFAKQVEDAHIELSDV